MQKISNAPRFGLTAAVLASMVLLAGCQTTAGFGHHGKESSVHADARASTHESPAMAAASKPVDGSPVPVLAIDAQGRSIIAYYGAPTAQTEGKSFTSPQVDGFYRVYAGHTEDGMYLVQDFYQDSGTPLTSVFPIRKGSNLRGWDTLPEQGEVKFFRPGGELRSITNYANGKLNGTDTYYNADGTERSVFHWSNDMLNGPFFAREPGSKRSVQGVASHDEIVSLTGTGPNGEALNEEQAMHLLNDSLLLWYGDMYK